MLRMEKRCFKIVNKNNLCEMMGVRLTYETMIW